MKSIDIVVGRISGFGGVENVISDWFINLRDEFNLKLVLPIDTSNDKWLLGKKYIRNKINSKNKLFIFFNGLLFTLRYLIYTDANILVIENYRIVLIASFIKKFFRKNYVVVSWMHQSLNIKKNMVAYLRYADYHLAIASGIKKQLLEGGVKREKVYLIYNPIKRKSESMTRNKNDELNLVYVGRPLLDGQKNLRELFDTLAQLDEEFCLSLYGVSEKDSEIVNYIKKLKLSNSIKLKGWQENPWKNINNSTCLVLTSKYEGLCLVLLESISRGLPVVASDVDVGNKDIVIDGANGYLYESGNLGDLQSKLKLVKNNNDLNNVKKVKETINCFYEENYYKNLAQLLNIL